MKQIGLYIALFIVLIPVFSIGQVSFKAYTSNDGLAHNTVLSIGQDGEGFMWFGTGNGLTRFDGKRFTSFRHSSNDVFSVPGIEIRQIETDKNGDIWIRTDGKIARFNKGSENFENFGYNQNGASHLNGRAQSIYSDPNGNLWVCTSTGLQQFNFQTNSFQPFERYKSQFRVSNLRDLFCDSEGHYWVITSDHIYIFDSLKKETGFKVIKSTEKNNLSLQSYTSITEGPDSRIYVSGFGNGVFSIDKKTLDFFRFGDDEPERKLSSNMLRSICFDANDQLWMATELGINIYNTRTKKISVCKQDFNNENSINDNAVYPVFKDKHGNMWAGTYFGGVNVSLSEGNHFKHYKAGEEPLFMSGKAVSQIIEDRKGNLWVGTEDGGINYFDTKKESFTHYSASKPQTVSYVNVHSLYIDQEQKLWIGTYLGGLNVFNGESFKYYRVNDRSKNWLRTDHIYALNSDDNDNIWVGTTGGLCLYRKESNDFKHFDGDIGWAHIYDILKSKDGSLWVGTSGRGLFYKEKNSEKFISLEELVNDSNAWFPSNISFLTESSDGLIWMGTLNQGLFYFDKKNRKLKRYTTDDGLPDNMIYAVVEDEQQNLWLTTNKGLVRFLRGENYFRLFTIDDGLPNNQFNFKGGYRHSDGTIYFGSVNGLIALKPDKIKFNSRPPEVKIVQLDLFNEPIKAGDESSILSKAIFNTEKIELKHNQNVIGFEFTAIDYTSPETNQFAYKMEGLEESWNEVGNYNRASYSHLPPGKYTFRVKACNNDGIWNEDGTSIDIVILPPFWLSIWGYLIYACLVLIVLGAYRRYTLIRAAEKSALEREKMEKEKIKELNQLKLKFYTNISHEFRTPLSLIVDPLQKMADNDIKNPKVKSTVNLVLKNAQRLQTLVNQLLDFRKTESGQFQLKVSEANIKEFVHNIFSRFIPLAESKKIEFTFEERSLPENVWFDKKVLDIILYNLLSNAFKFTSENGRISLKIQGDNTEKPNVTIWIEDTGTGISEEDLQKIFDRFYQVENHKTSESGSGIGLALTQNLVKLHKGEITVKSELTKGTTFSVQLPVHKEAYTKTECTATDIQTTGPIPEVSKAGTQIQKQEEIITDRTTKVLIVEDNHELREYIEDSLHKQFKTFTAENGTVGWEQVLKQTPDIIISDVMMPEMDGFEFCKRVKTDIRTSHIPVILLTAKSGVTNQTEGLKLGADIYLEKPFNSKILIAHLRNLIKLKERFIKRFETELGIDVAEVTHSTKDEEFIKKAIQVIFEHLDDSGFNVTTLTDKMAVSRSLLHMKLKEITGKSASEFIQFVKLKEAARLLKNNKLSISEVADKTGFNDPSYFSKCFKKQFKETPKEYQRKYED